MMATELVCSLRECGVRLWADGDKLRIEAPKGVMTPELLSALAKHKAELMALLQTPLPEPSEVADEVERLIALGQRLRRGEIRALRCGITGKRCILCAGVPCWGSRPWEVE